jgi:small subunit ribosomal protein S13
MLILFGKKISDDKPVRYALTKIFGIGITRSSLICNFLNIPFNLKIKDLTENQKFQITTYIKENFCVDLQLKTQIKNNIQDFIDIKSVRGFRHRSNLPVRGQRTHSNGKTRKRGII